MGAAIFQSSKLRANKTDALILGSVVLVGAGLSWLSGAHPLETPSWGPWEFSWIEFLGPVLALIWYFTGLSRMSPSQRPALWRRLAFALGAGSIYAATQTSLTYFAQHLFMATQIQQFVLHDIGPFLIALSWPGETLKLGSPALLVRSLQSQPISYVVRFVQNPAVAALLFLALFFGQIIPAIVFRLMLDVHLFNAMNILMAVEGTFFWFLVLDPRPKAQAGVSFFTRMALAFIVMAPVVPIGAFIALTSQQFYAFYDICGRLDWFSPANDQSLGGLILWIPSGLMGSLVVLLPLNAMRKAEEQEERLLGKTFVQIGQSEVDASAWTGRPF